MCKTKMIKMIKHMFIYKHIFAWKLLLACSSLYICIAHCISMLNFSKYEEQLILGWNLPPKNYEWPIYILKNYTSKSESAYNNMPLLIWITSDFGKKFAQKNMNDKPFEKMNVEFIISI